MLRADLTDVPLGELSALRKRVGNQKFAQLYRLPQNQDDNVDDNESGNRDEAAEESGFRRVAARSKRASDFPSDVTSRDHEYQTNYKESPSVQKRANHNQPLEVSTRRPTKFRKERLREFCAHTNFQSHTRDPRFDEQCGEYNDHAFRSTYSFLDELRSKEKAQLERTKLRLKKALAKAKSTGKNADEDQDGAGSSVVARKRQELDNVNYLLERFHQREVASERDALKKRVRNELIKNEREMVASGKRPYFAKRSELRKLELLERFRQLRKAGRLDSFLKKKRKRESSKQKRKLDVRL